MDWDVRYAEPELAGQGRNAVFLARRGVSVTAVDQSAVGLARARHLAASAGAMARAELIGELGGLEFLVAREIERDVHEGRYRDGRSAVLQILARRWP